MKTVAIKTVSTRYKRLFKRLFVDENEADVPLWNQYVSGIGLPTTFKSNLAVCPL